VDLKSLFFCTFFVVQIYNRSRLGRSESSSSFYPDCLFFVFFFCLLVCFRQVNLSYFLFLIFLWVYRKRFKTTVTVSPIFSLYCRLLSRTAAKSCKLRRLHGYVILGTMWLNKTLNVNQLDHINTISS